MNQRQAARCACLFDLQSTRLHPHMISGLQPVAYAHVRTPSPRSVRMQLLVQNVSGNKILLSSRISLTEEGGLPAVIPGGGVSINQDTFASLFLFCARTSTKTFRLVSIRSQNKNAAETAARVLVDCRGGGIRTPGSREGSPVFETGTLSHSVTPL